MINDPKPDLLEPVAGRLIEQLHTVAGTIPELGAKCADLEDRLLRFTARLTGDDPLADDDMPF